MTKQIKLISTLVVTLFFFINASYSQGLLDKIKKAFEKKVETTVDKALNPEKKKEDELNKKADETPDSKKKNTTKQDENISVSKNFSGYKYSEIKESDFFQAKELPKLSSENSRLKIAGNLFMDVKGKYPQGYEPKWRFLSYRNTLTFECANWVFQNARTSYNRMAFALGNYDGKAIIEFNFGFSGLVSYGLVDIKDIAILNNEPQTFRIYNFQKVINNRMSGEKVVSSSNSWYNNGDYAGKITLSVNENGDIKMNLLLESYTPKESRGRTYHEPQVFICYKAENISIENEMSPAKATEIVKAEQEAKQRQKDYITKITKQADSLQKIISRKYPQKDCRDCFTRSSNSNLKVTPTKTAYTNGYGDVYVESGTDWDINTKTEIKNKCGYSLSFIGLQQLYDEQRGYYLVEVTKTMEKGYHYSSDQGAMASIFSSLLGGGSEFNIVVQEKYFPNYATVGAVQWLKVVKKK